VEPADTSFRVTSLICSKDFERQRAFLALRGQDGATFMLLFNQSQNGMIGWDRFYMGDDIWNHMADGFRPSLYK
jgi:hypothetical protein